MLDVLLTGTRDGIGGALVLRGELLIPLLPRLAHLPEPQRDALLGIFGMINASAGQPLLVAVDEAQRLDNASAEILAFVARRLRPEPIAPVISVREPSARDFDGLPKLALSAPAESSARPSNLADQSARRVCRQAGRGLPGRLADPAGGAAGLLALGTWAAGGAAGRPDTAQLREATGHGTEPTPRTRDDPPDLGAQVLPDFAEAAVRSGNPDAARAALERLTERAVICGTPLACGLLARFRALVASAGELFTGMGMTAFARRANMEEHATGEHAGTGQLTPQEAQVVRLVIEGSTDRQIAARLFISPNTVEYSSRTQLVRTMLDHTPAKGTP